MFALAALVVELLEELGAPKTLAGMLEEPNRDVLPVPLDAPNAAPNAKPLPLLPPLLPPNKVAPLLL